jgi:hypothetical protein
MKLSNADVDGEWVGGVSVGGRGAFNCPGVFIFYFQIPNEYYSSSLGEQTPGPPIPLRRRHKRGLILALLALTVFGLLPERSQQPVRVRSVIELRALGPAVSVFRESIIIVAVLVPHSLTNFPARSHCQRDRAPVGQDLTEDPALFALHPFGAALFRTAQSFTGSLSAAVVVVTAREAVEIQVRPPGGYLGADRVVYLHREISRVMSGFR